MVMEELMLVNPEDAVPKRHRRKAKALQIIFPKPVQQIRVNFDTFGKQGYPCASKKEIPIIPSCEHPPDALFSKTGPVTLLR